ncbi:MAG TPA: hypothetical protein VEK08_10805 [Planctomycetota bacterium]|nr:hypothetical protein [Planctomycetota bacterium]
MKSFWSLMVLLALAAGMISHQKKEPASVRMRIPNDAYRLVVEDPPVEQMAPAASKTSDTAAPPNPAHAVPAAPKILVPVPMEGGTVERDENPRLVRMKDGSLVIDQYWTIPGGEGTPERPYLLTWDLLLSGQSSFDPAKPDAQLPERLKFLDGKHVSIKGYSLKSVTSGGASDEFLLNDQLIDNCPICLTRSVFATVLVKVKTPEVLERGVINVFTVRGMFKVQPSIQAGFLLGVFYLNDAEITSRTH